MLIFLLNLETTLKMRIVGTIGDKDEYKFKGMEKTNQFGGWLPHLTVYADYKYAPSMCCDGCELRVAQIPPELYRRNLENIFPQSKV